MSTPTYTEQGKVDEENGRKKENKRKKKFFFLPPKLSIFPLTLGRKKTTSVWTYSKRERQKKNNKEST